MPVLKLVLVVVIYKVILKVGRLQYQYK